MQPSTPILWLLWGPQLLWSALFCFLLLSAPTYLFSFTVLLFFLLSTSSIILTLYEISSYAKRFNPLFYLKATAAKGALWSIFALCMIVADAHTRPGTWSFKGLGTLVAEITLWVVIFFAVCLILCDGREQRRKVQELMCWVSRVIFLLPVIYAWMLFRYSSERVAVRVAEEGVELGYSDVIE